ncbi:phage capsid protein [Clostridium polyendosporum]|uniref:Phage capsid protein n=1 Tax=Clostridium polyendosporum TaxID=69208 RepID=A0A919VF30_9CLOT|nr:major capsid protein [Clostridium polyendosporum]GIM29819.1 phage capsid protein [Clostridium polyendosporum]
MNLQDFISAKEIALYIQNLPPRTTIDQALFPNTKQWGTEIELAKGSKQKPVALRMSTFDVAVKPRALKADLKIDKKELPFFKESVLIKEKDRQLLMMALQANNQNLVEQIVSQVYDNYQSLVDGAGVQATRMRAQLIQKGVINIVTDDGDIVVDYEVPAAHKETLTGEATWNNGGADIVGDIQRWQTALTDEGYAAPSRMLLTKTTFGYISQNTAILNELKARNMGEVIVTTQDIIAYLNRKLGISVGILNGTFIAEDGTTTMNYYEDDYITLIPDGTVGKTVYGTTPEEADKVYGTGKLDTQIVNTGVAITTMLKEDPVTVETKVSQLVLPSFDRADECFFAKVK